MTYDQLIEAGARSLGADEYWVISHPEGPLELTASKDFGYPIRVFCDATGLDWDEAVEQGWFLGKIEVSAPPKPAA